MHITKGGGELREFVLSCCPGQRMVTFVERIVFTTRVNNLNRSKLTSHHGRTENFVLGHTDLTNVSVQ